MAQITQLGRVMVPVNDQDAAIEWYTTNLGFSSIPNPPRLPHSLKRSKYHS